MYYSRCNLVIHWSIYDPVIPSSIISTTVVSVYFSPGGSSLNPRGRKYRITVLSWDRYSRAQLQVQLNMIGWILINHLVFSLNCLLTFELTRSVLWIRPVG